MFRAITAIVIAVSSISFFSCHASSQFMDEQNLKVVEYKLKTRASMWQHTGRLSHAIYEFERQAQLAGYENAKFLEFLFRSCFMHDLPSSQFKLAGMYDAGDSCAVEYEHVSGMSVSFAFDSQINLEIRVQKRTAEWSTMESATVPSFAMKFDPKGLKGGQVVPMFTPPTYNNYQYIDHFSTPLVAEFLEHYNSNAAVNNQKVFSKICKFVQDTMTAFEYPDTELFKSVIEGFAVNRVKDPFGFHSTVYETRRRDGSSSIGVFFYSDALFFNYQFEKGDVGVFSIVVRKSSSDRNKLPAIAYRFNIVEDDRLHVHFLDDVTLLPEDTNDHLRMFQFYNPKLDTRVSAKKIDLRGALSKFVNNQSVAQLKRVLSTFLPDVKDTKFLMILLYAYVFTGHPVKGYTFFETEQEDSVDLNIMDLASGRSFGFSVRGDQKIDISSN